MKSRITIEVDYDNDRKPAIRILQFKSDDVRDNLIQDFLQQLGHSSNWLKILFSSYPLTENGGQRITIRPISPEQLKEEAEIMLDLCRLENPLLKESMD